MTNRFKYTLAIMFLCSSVQSEAFSYTDLLKKSEIEQAEALLNVKDFLDLEVNTLFHPLPGGLTRAKLYTFEKDNKKYVLRFLALGPSQPKHMRQNEIRALEIGSNLKIAPQCVFSDPNAVLMVMPLIEGHSLHNPDEFELEKLGKMLRALHNFPGEYPTRNTFQERINIHYQKGIEAGVAYPTGFDQEIQKVLAKTCPRDYVPTHGDLNPSNILVSANNIAIIDWTNATLGDPFSDLSYFCQLSNLSLEQETIFLEAYFGRMPTENECLTLKEEKAKVNLLTAVIWFRFSETPEDKKIDHPSRIAALDAELDSDSLKPAQEYLREGTVVDMNTAPKCEVKSYALSFYKAYLN